jgi:hypothetical protein
MKVMIEAKKHELAARRLVSPQRERAGHEQVLSKRSGHKKQMLITIRTQREDAEK